MGVWAAIATGGARSRTARGRHPRRGFLSWPWIFFVNVPKSGSPRVWRRFLSSPESRDAGHKTYDIPGAVMTVTAGLIMPLVYGIVSTEQNGWGSPQTLSFLALAVVLLSAFRH